MKINRYFPPCPNCLSHLLILECSYESYQPRWPHLSFQFFFIQWQPLSSPHPRYPLDFASLWLHPGFLGQALFCPPDSECVVTLRLASSPWTPPPCSPWWFPPSSCGLPSWALTPFSWKIPLLPHIQCSLNWGLLTSGFFQLETFNLIDAIQSHSCSCLGVFLLSCLFIRYSVWGSSLAISSCFVSAYINVTQRYIYEMLCVLDVKTQHSSVPCGLSASSQGGVDKLTLARLRQTRPWECWLCLDEAFWKVIISGTFRPSMFSFAKWLKHDLTVKWWVIRFTETLGSEDVVMEPQVITLYRFSFFFIFSVLFCGITAVLRKFFF